MGKAIATLCEPWMTQTEHGAAVSEELIDRNGGEVINAPDPPAQRTGSDPVSKIDERLENA